MANNDGGDPRDKENIPPVSFDRPQHMETLMPAPFAEGHTNIQIFGGFVTAQKVSLPRRVDLISREIEQWASEFGEELFYSWDVTGKDGKKSEVAGLTIKGAQCLIQLWGNCDVDCRVIDEGTHFTYLARFVDLEKGTSITRPFRQRKSMDLGKKMNQDADRKLDIQFQIGASKATRNAVNSALRLFADKMVERAKVGLIDWVKNNRPKAKENIEKFTKFHDLPIKAIEAYVGTEAKNWTDRHVAKILRAFKSVSEGDATITDVFGVEAGGDIVTTDLGAKAADKQEDKAAGKTADKPAENKKKQPDKEPAKAKEPEKKPEPEEPKEEPKPEPKKEAAKKGATPPEPSDDDLDAGGAFDWMSGGGDQS